MKIKRKLLLSLSLLFSLMFFAYSARVYIDAVAIGKDSILRIHNYTKKIMDKLDDPLYIEYIRSEPNGTQNRNDIRYIENILIKIKRIGHGNIILTIRQPLLDEESILEDYGFLRLIQQSPDGSPESLYSGIKLTYRNRFKIIPLVLSPADLEFSIVNAVNDLLGSPLPLVTFLSGRNGQDLQETYSQLLDSVGAVFPTAVINSDDPLPVDTGILIIVNYEDLSERWIITVDEFLKQGNHVVVLGSGIVLQPDQSDFGEDPGPIPFDQVFEKHGIKVSPLLVGKQPGVWIQDPEGSGAMAYPLWFTAEPSDGILDSFNDLKYLWASPIGLSSNNINVHYVDEAFLVGEPYPIRPGLEYPDEWTSDLNNIPVAVYVQTDRNGSLTLVSSSYSFSGMALTMGYSNHFSMMLNYLLNLSYSKELAELRSPDPHTEITGTMPHPLLLIIWILLFPIGALGLHFILRRRRKL